MAIWHNMGPLKQILESLPGGCDLIKLGPTQSDAPKGQRSSNPQMWSGQIVVWRLYHSCCASLRLLSSAASHVPAEKEQRQGGGVQESGDRGHQPPHLHCQATADHAER